MFLVYGNTVWHISILAVRVVRAVRGRPVRRNVGGGRWIVYDTLFSTEVSFVVV